MPGMKGTRAAEGVLFFFAMEFLQFIQYFYIADNLKDPKCKNLINQVLTLVGFLHICLQVLPAPPLFPPHFFHRFFHYHPFQPYYTHVMNAAMTPHPDNDNHKHRISNADHREKLRLKHAKFSVIQKLCLIGGGLLFARCLLAMNGQYTTLDMSRDADISAVKPMQEPNVCSAIFPILS